MLLSNSKKFAFIHVYKVAGTSVKNALREYDCLHHQFLSKLITKITKFKVYPDNYIGKLRQLNDLYTGHGKLHDLERYLPKELYQQYFKFALVRNPWSWQVSFFEYTRRQKTHFQHDLMNQFLSFEDYLQWRLEGEFRLQTDFILNNKGEFDLNYLGRLETIDKDWAEICQKIGITKNLTKLNSSNKKDYRSYYTDATAALVEEAYRQDIENFGYDFDGISNQKKALLPISQELTNPDE